MVDSDPFVFESALQGGDSVHAAESVTYAECDKITEPGGLVLHRAVAEGLPQAVTKLLEAGFDVNATDGTGTSALHVAGCSETGQHMVQILVDFGGRLHGKDVRGHQPLHYFVLNSELFKVAEAQGTCSATCSFDNRCKDRNSSSRDYADRHSDQR